LAYHVANFLKREDGPTAVEYAVMLALIIVVCIGAITVLQERQQYVQQCRPERCLLRQLNETVEPLGPPRALPDKTRRGLV
jgi:hypothetical protein